MKQRIRVGIIFGGKSAEHEVSLQSAKNVIAAIDREKYEPVLIGIDIIGVWHLTSEEQLSTWERVKVNRESLIALAPGGNGKILSLNTTTHIDITLDVVFPVLHGTFGEDGTMQGLLKLADVPFVGSGVLGSAVGMDKDVMKRLLRDAGIPVSKFLVCRKETAPSYEKARTALGTPLFVKPANAGSSIGVSKVRTEEEYETAVQEAFLYDRKIIIEENVSGREIECAVLGNDHPIASVPGEVIPHHDFYSYEAKYGMDGVTVEIPANLSIEDVARIQELAVMVFQVLEASGLGRVDFFRAENGDLFANEINTLPGFTSTSVYPKLFEASGISYRELIDRLITLAFERFEIEKKLKTRH